MVAQSSDDTSGLNPRLDRQQLECLQAWIRPLQQSLALEAERGFLDLQGRNECFHAFLSRQLSSPPPVALPNDSLVRLRSLASEFSSYPDLADAGRRRLVSGTRQWLHGLRARMEPSTPMAPPRLKVATTQQGVVQPGSGSDTLGLDSPLLESMALVPNWPNVWRVLVFFWFEI